MTPVIEGKRAALSEYMCSSTENSLHVLSLAKSRGQQENVPTNTGWSSASTYTMQQHQTIFSGMYEGIKKDLGPTKNRIASLKSSSVELITDNTIYM